MYKKTTQYETHKWLLILFQASDMKNVSAYQCKTSIAFYENVYGVNLTSLQIFTSQ